MYILRVMWSPISLGKSNFIISHMKEMKVLENLTQYHENLPNVMKTVKTHVSEFSLPSDLSVWPTLRIYFSLIRRNVFILPS